MCPLENRGNVVHPYLTELVAAERRRDFARTAAAWRVTHPAGSARRKRRWRRAARADGIAPAPAGATGPGAVPEPPPDRRAAPVLESTAR
jgi:hypothetical protein